MVGFAADRGTQLLCQPLHVHRFLFKHTSCITKARGLSTTYLLLGCSDGLFAHQHGLIA